MLSHVRLAGFFQSNPSHITFLSNNLSIKAVLETTNIGQLLCYSPNVGFRFWGDLSFELRSISTAQIDTNHLNPTTQISRRAAVIWHSIKALSLPKSVVCGSWTIWSIGGWTIKKPTISYHFFFFTHCPLFSHYYFWEERKRTACKNAGQRKRQLPFDEILS